MSADLQNIIKALLISTGDPLDPKDIQKIMTRYHDEHLGEGEVDDDEGEAEAQPGGGAEGDGEAEAPGFDLPKLVPIAQIREAIEVIQERLEEESDVFRIVETHQGYRIMTAPRYSEWVRLLRDEPRPLKLSPAAMETLAIVAYRQPVTRAEMETIRGVSVDSGLNKCLEHDLVQIVGRAELPGRPIQYGTSEKFLEFAGIRSTEELPASDIISQQRLDTWIRQANQQHPLSDEDVGLPASEQRGEAATEDVAGEAGRSEAPVEREEEVNP
jgi:segregation and condensation protein B